MMFLNQNEIRFAGFQDGVKLLLEPSAFFHAVISYHSTITASSITNQVNNCFFLFSSAPCSRSHFVFPCLFRQSKPMPELFRDPFQELAFLHVCAHILPPSHNQFGIPASIESATLFWWSIFHLNLCMPRRPSSDHPFSHVCSPTSIQILSTYICITLLNETNCVQIFPVAI